MDLSRHHARARNHGANRFVYWTVRAFFQPFFHIYFRFERVGREHVPREGAAIFASNHRSFLDPFVIGTVARRPVYYVTKSELFSNRFVGWILNSLGAFPVARGVGDQEMVETAKAILARGDLILIFPEGSRTRPGSLGSPRRGVGRLALETGAPVIPVAVIGTEAVRRGWRFRPHKVRIRVGCPQHFPAVENPSQQLVAEVTDRIWLSVMLQWEWLGGLSPLRRAVVLGSGGWAAGLAVLLAQAGLRVELGCHNEERVSDLRAQCARADGLAAAMASEDFRVCLESEVAVAQADLVCFAVASDDLPAAIAIHGDEIAATAGVVVTSTGLVAPNGALASEYVGHSLAARAVATIVGALQLVGEQGPRQSLALGSLDPGFLREVAALLARSSFSVKKTDAVVGVELAGCAAGAAAIATAAASPAGASLVGLAGDSVLAEVARLALARDADCEGFITSAVGQELRGVDRNQAEADVRQIALLIKAAQDAGVDAPAIDSLYDLLQGRIDASQSAAANDEPQLAQKVRVA